MTRGDVRERRNLPAVVAGTLIGIAIIALIVFGALRMMRNSSVAPPPTVQKIVVMPRQELPPPPPPPEEQPPPEEEKIEEPVPEEEPVEPEPNEEPAPGDDLGVDADGAGDGDGFGLVGKKGGRGLIGGGDQNRWYASMVQQDLQRRLMDDERARKGRYAVVIRLWFTPDGHVLRYEISGRTGDEISESGLRAVLDSTRMESAPPDGMPQPMKLRIVSR